MAPPERVQIPPPPAQVVAQNLDRLRRRIEACGRDPDEVTIVAVTKGFTADAVKEALAAGICDIGENYAQELIGKAAVLSQSAPSPGPLRWHFLGAIQRRRVKQLVPVVDCWQTVSRLVEAQEISQLAGRVCVMIEVEATGIAGRNGCAPEVAGELVVAVQSLGLEVRGLMTVGPPGAPELSRFVFRRTAALARELGLRELSMGMSDDLEIALDEGATMVRVGRALFGDRELRAR